MKEPIHNQGDFRKRVENYLPQDLPAELSWEEMSMPLLQGLAQEKKRRRRRRFFAWFLPSFVCFIGVSLFLLWPKNPETISTHENTEITSTLPEGSLTSIQPDSSSQSISTKPNPNTEIHSDAIPSLSNAPRALPSAPAVKKQAAVTPSTEQRPESGTGLSQNLTFLSAPPVSLIPEIPKPLPSDYALFLPQKLPLSPRPQSAILFYGGVNRFSSSFLPFEEGDIISQTQRPDRMGFQTGVAVQHPLSPTLFLTTGLELERLRYEVGLEREENVRLFRPGTIDTLFINSRTGDSTFVFTDSIPGIRSLLLRNTFSTYSIKIPVLLSHRFYLQKVSLDLQGGISVGLFQRNRGLDNEQVQRLLGESDLLSEQGMTLALNGGFQVMYPLAKDLQIVGIAGIEKGVMEWNSSPQSTYTQRPILYQLKLGITKLLPQKTK